jgi:hypothetical protein
MFHTERYVLQSGQEQEKTEKPSFYSDISLRGIQFFERGKEKKNHDGCSSPEIGGVCQIKLKMYHSFHGDG